MNRVITCSVIQSHVQQLKEEPRAVIGARGRSANGWHGEKSP